MVSWKYDLVELVYDRWGIFYVALNERILSYFLRKGS